MNPREKQLVAALEAAKEHLEYTGYGDSWERSTVMPDLPKQINDALEAAKTGPAFYESKFEARHSMASRQKIEGLKEQVVGLNHTLSVKTEAINRLVENIRGLQGSLALAGENLKIRDEQVNRVTDALNVKTDECHKALAARDLAKVEHAVAVKALNKLSRLADGFSPPPPPPPSDVFLKQMAAFPTQVKDDRIAASEYRALRSEMERLVASLAKRTQERDHWNEKFTQLNLDIKNYFLRPS